MMWIVMRSLACLFFFVSLLPSCSSSKSCTTEAVLGVSLRVFDGGSAAPLCDAKAHAHGTSASGKPVDETLQVMKNGTECTYVGLAEAPGDYDIDISHDGFVTATQHVSLQESSGDCPHVVPYSGNVNLVPVAPPPSANH